VVINTTLIPAETDPEIARKAILARNTKILNAFQKDLARRGLSYKMVEQHVGNIENFAQTSLLTQDPPHGLLDTTLEDMQAYLRTAGNKTAATSFKRFIRFLLDTGRMDYDQAEPLLDALKQIRE
jgi:hypothetical protein